MARRFPCRFAVQVLQDGSDTSWPLVCIWMIEPVWVVGKRLGGFFRAAPEVNESASR